MLPCPRDEQRKRNDHCQIKIEPTEDVWRQE